MHTLLYAVIVTHSALRHAKQSEVKQVPSVCLEQLETGALVGVPVGDGVVGAPVAGDAVAGAAVAGAAVAGDAVAGAAVAGDAMAGDAVAGATVAGDAVAGAAVAGALVGSLVAVQIARLFHVYDPPVAIRHSPYSLLSPREPPAKLLLASELQPARV